MGVGHQQSILLIVTGGIAAYKSIELIRRLREEGIGVTPVLTASGAEFVTPLSLAAIAGEKVYQDLFSLTDETEMGHIELSRRADLVVVAPATANILAKLTHGIADDLATTLLATDKRVLLAPAMNVRMWEHPATQANLATLKSRGVTFVGPNSGEMACGEFGPGRLAEPLEILAGIQAALSTASSGRKPLEGRRALVTSGPTHAPLDPVRFLGNRSSGRQGQAVAEALRDLGAEVTLISGPTHLTEPHGVTTVKIETALQMLAACQGALPVDIAVCAAAVADWRPEKPSGQKIKKDGPGAPEIAMVQNPDILAALSKDGADRPALVVGFAAETEKVLEHARAKLRKKGCDWILANDVSDGSGTFGGSENTLHLVHDAGEESWPRMSKKDAARRLAEKIADTLANPAVIGEIE